MGFSQETFRNLINRSSDMIESWYSEKIRGKKIYENKSPAEIQKIFQITEKNEILVMDKVATPWIEQSKKGQKGGKKKVKNTSEELIEIVPSAINQIWSRCSSR